MNGDVGKSFDFFVADCGHDDPSKHMQAGYNWPASETPFKWRFAKRPIVARDCMQVELFCRIWVTIRSILTQIDLYVFLVLFTNFHFTLKSSEAKIVNIYSTKKLRKSQKTMQHKYTKANNYSIFIYLFRYMSSVEKNVYICFLAPLPLLWHSVK